MICNAICNSAEFLGILGNRAKEKPPRNSHSEAVFSGEPPGIRTPDPLITKQKQADIIVLDMPLLDTRQGRDLTGALISDIVLQLLSHVAQTEREFIRQRQAEGIEAARAKGIRFGRPRLDRPQAFEALRVQWMQGNISSRKAAAQLGISYQTFLRWAKEKTEPAEESPEPAEESPEPVLKEEVM